MRKNLLKSTFINENLYKVCQVPDHFKEPFILTGYRFPNSTLLQCLCSFFQAHNETLNMWTHIVATIYFFVTFIHCYYNYGNFNAPYYWPLFANLLGTCCYSFVSAMAHTLNTMSINVRHVCFMADYAALSVYGYAIAVACHAYALPISWRGNWLESYYVPFSAVLALVSTWVSCQTRFMHQSMVLRLVRISAFALPCSFALVPVAIRLLYCHFYQLPALVSAQVHECQLPSLWYWRRLLMLDVIFLVFFYVLHVPERFFPGKFDIIGHSHQLFHVMGTLASYDQIFALLLDLDSRQSHLVKDLDKALCFSAISVSLVALANVLLVIYFWLKLCNLPSKRTYQTTKKLF